MGVSGSGKSTIGDIFARKLKYSYFDGDDYHSAYNVSKMQLGQALSDEDRFDWLLRLNKLAIKEAQKNDIVISCSALKEQYRKILEKGIKDHSIWIFLKGDFETIAGRIRNRKGHFMSMELLQSQFDILEEPTYGIQVDINQPVEIIVRDIIQKQQK